MGFNGLFKGLACSVFLVSLSFEMALAKTTTVSNRDQLLSALGQLQSGDTIVLNTASYGVLYIQDKLFNKKTIIKAASGAKPEFERIFLRESSKIEIRDVNVRPDVTYPNAQYPAISIRGGSGHRVLRADVRYSTNTSGWNANDWVLRTSSAVKIESGSGHQVLSSKMINVGDGVVADGEKSVIRGNFIDKYRRDGVRATKSGVIIERNIILNSMDVDDNHDDAIQAWTLGAGNQAGQGVITGLVIKDNYILDTTNRQRAFNGPLQGIGLFDGIYKNLKVINNTVVTDGYIGIAIYGADQLTVEDNTVIDPVPGGKVPTFNITNHKDGRPTKGLKDLRNVAPVFENMISGGENDNLVVNTLGGQ